MRELVANSAIFMIVLGAACAIGACGRSADDTPVVTSPFMVSLDDSLRAIASETGLAVIDLSVPFERFGEAPDRLRRIADAVAGGSAGLYVLRYHDDTLRHTQHVFAIGEGSRMYIKLTAIPNGQPARTDSVINTAEYDELTKTLTLHTETGEFRLTPGDITPVGA